MESTWSTLYPDDLELLGAPAFGAGVRMGVIAMADPADGLWVTYAGAPMDAPLAALTTVPVTPDDEGRRVVLIFADGDPEQPIVTGFIQEQAVTATVEPAARTEARVDGRRIRLEAEREILLQCGRSSLLLRADGKIVVKGMEIVSRAKRANKVKGGTVRIN